MLFLRCGTKPCLLLLFSGQPIKMKTKIKARHPERDVTKAVVAAVVVLERLGVTISLWQQHVVLLNQKPDK